MLLTSWIRALRQSFTRHRLSRARRKQSDARRQNLRHARLAEVLEERSLLSIRPLVIDINPVTGTNVFTSTASTPGISITNSLLDPNNDGISDYDDLVIGVSQSANFESTVISGAGVGIRINLSNLTGLNHISIDNVFITAGANQQGISITLDNVALQSLAVDQTNVTPTGTGGTGLDIGLKNMSSTTGVDVSIQNSNIRSGSTNFSGVNVTLESVSKPTHIGELTLSDSTVEGYSVVTSVNSILYAAIDQASVRNSRIQNGAANPSARGITYTLNRTTVGDLRVEENINLRNVAITTTDSPLSTVSISNNPNFNVAGFAVTDTIRDAIRINATSTNAVGTQRSDVTNLRIVGNTITGSGASGIGAVTANGIALSLTDSNLGNYGVTTAGARIAGNTISNLSGTANNPAAAISVLATATSPFVVGNGGLPLLLDFQGDGTANDTNGITQNTLTANNGRGIVVTGRPDTSFLADVTANIIDGGAAANRREGVSVTVAVRPTLVSRDSFSLNFSDNTINGSQGSAVSLALQDTAIGSFVIRNNEITNSTSFPVASTVTATTPDGLSVVLEGTNSNQGAVNILKSSLIEGNFIGVTRSGLAGPNAANGVLINSQEASIVQDLQILNNTFQNNGLNNSHAGLQFLREDKSELVASSANTRAVTVSGNTFGQNRNGILIDARNGSLDLLDFGISSNFIGVDANGTDIGNIDDGINLRTQADARLLADITNNQIRFNNGNGINLNDVFANFETDKRQIGGTWINNTISDNSQNGILIAGRHGLSDEVTGINTPLVIGQEGQSNLIENNGGNGIRIFGVTAIPGSHRSTATGSVSITDNTIRTNSSSGLFLQSASERIDIRHNQIEANIGKGIDIEVVHSIPTVPTNVGLPGLISATIRDNVITGQRNGAEQGDGIELTGFETLFAPLQNAALNVLNVLAINNFIDSNEGRGVDVLNIGNGAMQIRFGDGTEQGRNTIVGNELDGFRVVNTGALNQEQVQDGVPNAATQFLGVTQETDTDDSLYSPDMMLDVSRNTIRDNGISLPAPRQSGGTSDVNASGLVILAAGVGNGVGLVGGGDNSFAATFPNEVGNNSGDYLAGNGRINLRVTDNTLEGNFGNDFAVVPYIATIPPTTVGQWDTTAFRIDRMWLDPLIRINAIVTGNTGNGLDVIRPAPDYVNSEPVFKRRLLPPTAPAGPFNSGTRPRNATRLATDSIPNPIENGFSFVYPGSDERFIPQPTTLRVEAGFDRSGTTEGFPFYSPSAPGPGSDDNFDDPIVAIVNGRIDMIWDTVLQGTFTFPNVDSPTFVTPSVSNFPTLGNSTPGTVTVNFSEYVRFVDITDFRLLRDNAVVSLAGLAVSPVNSSEDPNNPGAFRSFTIDLTSVTSLPGDYQFQVLAVDSSNPTFTAIRDVHLQFNNQGNPLTRVTDGDGVLQDYALNYSFTVDTSRPAATISPITPDPRNSAAGVVTVNFDEDVTGIDIADFELYRNDGVSMQPVNLGSIGVTQVTASQYTLNLNQLSGAPGTYELRLVSTDLNTVVQDLAGNSISEPVASTLQSDISSSDSEVTLTSLAGFPLFASSDAPFVIAIEGEQLLVTAVTGATLTVSRGFNGTTSASHLAAAAVTLKVADSDTWLVDTTLPFVNSVADSLVTTTITSPVNAHPASVIINFSETVSGVDNSDFTLLLTNTAGITSKIDISSPVLFPLFELAGDQYELNLLAMAATPGTYRLTINPLNSGIVDIAGNSFLTSFSTSWVLDVAAPLADIVDVAPDPRQTPVDALNTIFSEKVTFENPGDPLNPLDASAHYVLAYDDGTAATAGSISDATNGGTIVVTSMAHGLADGDRITIYGVQGNTNANGVFTVTKIDDDQFSLDSSIGSDIYSGGGRWVRTVSLTGLTVSQQTDTRFVLNLSSVTLDQGTYILSLLADGTIKDVALNAVGPATGQFNVAAQDIWTNGPDAAPTGTIDAITSPRGTNAGVIVVTFSEPLQKLSNGNSSVDAKDFTLTRGGSITGATNVSPIVITSVKHGLVTGDQVTISGVAGNTAANGIFTITVVDQNQFRLNSSTGNGVYVAGTGKWTRVVSLSSVPITQTGPTTYTVDLSASGLTDVDGTYTLRLLNSNTATPDTVSPLKDLTGNSLSDDSDPLTATGIASEIVWIKDGTLSGPQVTSFIDQGRVTVTTPAPSLQGFTKLRAVDTLTINFSENVTGIDVTDASKNFLLTRQATGGVAIPVSLDNIPVQKVTESQYRINLSTLTGTDGTYRLTVLANGLIKNKAAVPVELKNPQTVTWLKDGTMRPSTVGDSIDSSQGNEVVGSGSAYSLRQAIQEANALAGDDVIELGAGTYTLSLAGVQEDFAAVGDLDIRQNLVIRGKGVGVTIIDATALANQLTTTNRDRLFQILPNVTVTIQGVTIQNGAVTGSEDGGAVRNSGNLTILDSLIRNSTSQDDGGAINNTGTLTINRTTISGNTAVATGGAIRNAGTLLINNSTLSGNRTTGTSGHGGALMNVATFSATLEGVTISGNTAQSATGGGIRNDGNLRLINDTIAFNRSLNVGAGISRNLGTVTIGNTIVSDNTLTNAAATPSDVAGTFVSLGGNLVRTLGTAVGFTGIGDQPNVNPNLQPLGNNGGPTQTHALPAFDVTGLLPNPAIDRGLDANVTDQNHATSLDQRGALRFLDGPNVLNTVDVGAFEFGTFFVNTTDDSIDVTPGDGLAEDGLRQTSLRSAIMESNALGGESAIMLDGKVYSLKRLVADTTAPTVVSITGVPLATITTGGVGVVTITFSERVAGLDLAHILFTRTTVVGGVPTLTQIPLPAATFQLTKVSDLVYKIENKADIAAGVLNTGLTSVTQTNGLYSLTINPTANVLVNGVSTPVNIRDIENLNLAAAANVNWVRGTDTFAPSVTITPATITNQFIQNAGTVTVTFSEKVTGVSASNFTLTRNGTAVTGLVVTPITNEGINFAGRTAVTINLQTLTALNGNYALTFNPAVGANITIKDSASNNLTGGIVTRNWTKSAGVRLADVSSNALNNNVRVDELTKVRLQFTERVAGVKLDNFTLTFDDGSGIGPQLVDLSQATLAPPVGTPVTAVPGFGNAAEQWELTFSNKQAARDGVYVLTFDGLANGNQLVTTATTATIVVPFTATIDTATFQVGEDLSRIGDLDVIVGAGRVQIFGKGKDDSTTILGNPQPRTVIDGKSDIDLLSHDRLFDLTVGSNVSFNGVELINGKVVYERSGGAIRNLGTLTINDSDVGTTNGATVQGNFADGNGGAIFNAAPSAPITAVLQVGVNAIVNLITVDSVASFPTTVPFQILVDSEYMQVTAVNVATNEFTVIRSVANPAAHAVNATVSLIAARVGIIGSLQAAATNAVATLTLVNVTAFPSTAPFIILVDSEQMQVTVVNVATNQFTVSRGFGGTTAVAHAANAVVTLLSSTTINRSNLQNNIAGSATSGSQFGKGGAIYNENGAVTINEGAYSANQAVTDGGAIYNGNQATAELVSTSFTTNLAGRDGGAIYNNNSAILKISTSTLSGNRADASVNGVVSDSNGDGGAIYNETSATLVLDDSLLQNNSARNGGALYNDDGTLVLNRDTFGVNSALENGGAIFNTSGGSLTLNQGLFTTNSASDNGGAIQNFGNLVVLDVAGTGTQFLSNEAGTDVRASDTNNGKGGAIFNQDGVVDISSATFTLNRSHGDAGVIFNDGDGTLTVRRTTFDRNSADANGGVLVNNDFAQVTIDEVTFSNNKAVNGDGGAIYNNSDFTSGSTQSLTIDDTTLNDNLASRGGAIFNTSAAGLTMTNSTLSANTATTSGGGLANFGTASLLNDTLFENNAPVGAGIANNVLGTPPFGPITLKNTLVAGSTSGADIDGDNFINGGHNLIQAMGAVTAYLPDGTTLTTIANGDGSGDIVGQNPQLDILRDNGGPTLTHALLFGSPARDAGDNFAVKLNDQRGLNRVFDGDGNGVATVDIGAFESGFVVNSFLDTVDENPGDGINADANGRSTLRAAIMEANARPGEDTIILGPGIFTLTLTGRAEDFRSNLAGNIASSSETGDLDILDDLNIIGAGTDLTFIDAAQIDRLFQIFPGVNLKLSNLTLQNGNATSTDVGGAIFNQGTTTLDNVLVINSSAGRGGGIYNGDLGTLTIEDSLFRGNQAVQQGGALYNDGVLTLLRSDIGAVSRLAAAIPYVIGKLQNDVLSGGTTVTLVNASTFPTTTPFVIQVDSELMLVTGVAGNVLTVDRGVNDTTAAAHAANATVTPSVTVTVSNVSDFPTSGPFVIQVDSERMLVTSVLGDEFTVTRGYNGTVVTTHSASAFATLGNTANIHGGGLYNLGGATITQSSFSGNLAQSRGGGLYNAALTGQLAAVAGNLQVAATNATLQIQLVNVASFPNVTPFTIQVDSEQMVVTAVAGGNVFTVTRAANGTTAAAHQANAVVTLLSIPATATTITLNSVAAFPATGSFTIQIDSEKMTASVNLGTNTLTVQRGILGTTAVAHLTGAIVTSVGQNQATIQQSTFLDNFASSRGAAIYNEEDLTIKNSTLSNNDSGTNAALGNSVSGKVKIENSTVVDNVAYRGGGLSNSLIGTVEVHNTIVANNASTAITGAKAPNVRGTFTSKNNNFIGNNADSGLSFVNGTNFDQVGSGTSPFDPVLKTLANNGGPTQTHSARTGSPIIDAGNNAGGDPFDQRGAIRPTNSDSDIGAVELQDVHVTINDVTLKEGNSGSTIFTFTLSLTKPSIQEIRVHYTLQGDTAFAGEDFVDVSGDVVFAPNQLNQTLEVLVNGDPTIEPDEQFLVNLSVPANAAFTPTLDRTQAIGTILSDDTGIRITNYNKVEKDPTAADQDYDFSVSVVGALLTAVPGTLQQAVDSSATSTTLTLVSVSAFPTTVPFTIQIDSEQMQVTFVDAGTNEFTVVRGFNGTTLAVHAANASVNRTFLVNYTIADGTATVAGLDYAPVGLATGTLTFIAGSNGQLPVAQHIHVNVKADQLVEANETFFVNLTSTDLPFEFDKDKGVGTIFNDDLGFNVSSPLPPTQEGIPAPNDVVNFVVSLQERVYTEVGGVPVQATIKANVETTDGSATAGSGDYTSVSQTLTFSGTNTTANVAVTVLDDLRFESNETFELRVTKGFINGIEDSNAVLNSVQGEGTISDDDDPPDIWRVYLDSVTGNLIVDLVEAGGVVTTFIDTPVDNAPLIIDGDFGGPAQDDLFIVFVTNGNPIPTGGLTVNGFDQVGADTLKILDSEVDLNDNGTVEAFEDLNGNGVFDEMIGTTFGTVDYFSTAADAGSVVFDGTYMVTYSGLEPIADLTTADSRTFHAPDADLADDIILISVGNTSTSISGTTTGGARAFEDVTFRNPTTLLTVIGNDDKNFIQLSGGAAASTFALIVDAGVGDDTINAESATLPVTLNGESGADSITGGDGNDLIDGGADNDTIVGGLGNDTLLGNLNDDSIMGGGGDDSIEGGDGKDTILGEAGIDNINGGVGDDSIDGGADNDTVNGGADNDIVRGGDGLDTVLGDAGNDSLFGDNGVDLLIGGFGDDTMSGDAGNDIIDGLGGDDVIRYTTNPSDPLAQNDNITLTSTRLSIKRPTTEIEFDLVSNTERAELTAGSGNNKIDASTFGGSVTMNGLGGNDTLLGGSGSDSMTGGAGNDTASGGIGFDTINGGDGNDTINGDAGDDVITGDDGVDLIDGGTGNDNASGGTGNDVLTGGTGIDTLDGGADQDTLFGGTEGDSLLGGAGQDLINGEKGDDTIHGDDVGDSLFAGDDTVYGGEGNDYVGGGRGNDTLEGNLGDDTVNGNDGNDTLDGSGTGNGNITLAGNDGLDTLYGGSGDDELISNDGNDLLIGQGGSNDKFTFNGGVTLADIFTITLAGNGDPLGTPTGIALARLNPGLTFTTILLGVEIFTLNLNGGNDLVTLNDLAGVLDLTVLNINGGDGNDTIDGSLSTSETVAIRAFMGLGNDSVQGTAAGDTIQGEAGDDKITANAGNDSVVGGDGNDSLDGNDGMDTINGGLGNDTIWGGAGNDSLLGLDGLDTIWGQGGNDTMDGGIGNDFLDGGYGNANTPDSGDDSIRGGAGNDKIAGRDGLDKLYGDANNDTITGGMDNDTIDGGTGDDLVDGGDGNDVINGGAGNDILLGGLGSDSILGGAGTDRLVGGGEDDTLDGQGGTDTVLGGDGLGTDTHTSGDKRIGETINELFKLTSIRSTIFNELNF